MKVVIASACRTPVANINGAFATLTAANLGSIAIKEALKRANVEGNDVDEVIMGQVLQASQAQNPVRQASVKAGVPHEVPAYGVNMLCGSGLKSVMLGAQAIKNGDSKVVVAGGMESMTQAPHCVQMRAGVKFGDAKLEDSMLKDGLTDCFDGIHMGVTAENIAKKFNLSREAQDQFAVSSQNKAEEAIKAGLFKAEIVPVEVASRKATVVVDTDEFPRAGATMASIGKPKPAFQRDGTGSVTAANASGINDGAAAVVLMSDEDAAARKIDALATIVAFSQAGVDPKIMGTGPIPAVTKVLEKTGWNKDEVDIFELNEAFAAQSLACVQELGLDASKVNVNGGAIAIGHPIGCSGTRVLVTLIHAMKARGAKKGICSLCVGGGMGVAMALEM